MWGAAARVVPAEVGLRRRLDPVGALAEVDLVQVLGEDLVLVPVALELVGEGRLAELLEHGAAALGAKRVLDELLGDRRGTLGGALVEDVLEDGAADALVVDPAVLVEALVLDRHRGLLHHRGDVRRVDQDPALVVGQGGDLLAVDVVDDRVLGVLELGAVLELGQVARDGHHDPEDPGDEGEHREAQEDQREAQLLELRAPLGRLGAGGRRRDRRGLAGRLARRRIPPR